MALHCLSVHQSKIQISFLAVNFLTYNQNYKLPPPGAKNVILECLQFTTVLLKLTM